MMSFSYSAYLRHLPSYVLCSLSRVSEEANSLLIQFLCKISRAGLAIASSSIDSHMVLE